MDDGTADRSGFVLHVNYFTLPEVELLVKALKTKFDLNCSIRTRMSSSRNTQYMIYIKKDSWENSLRTKFS
jgi:hypothetical protein